MVRNTTHQIISEIACLATSVVIAMIIILSLDFSPVIVILMGMVIGIGGVVSIHYIRMFKNYEKWLEER